MCADIINAPYLCHRRTASLYKQRCCDDFDAFIAHIEKIFVRKLHAEDELVKKPRLFEHKYVVCKILTFLI